MKNIPISKAKAHFSRLLDDLLKSHESIQITRHGVAIARIVSEKAFEGERVDAVIAQIKKIRKGAMLNGLTIQKLRDEGSR
jgi:antitoxin (DNA-binding transcriptional repressor) of toxin-antitoxin stability system